MGAFRKAVGLVLSMAFGAVPCITATAAGAGAATTSVVGYGAAGYRYLQVPIGGGPADFAEVDFDDSDFLVGSAPFGDARGTCELDPVTFWSRETDLLVRRNIWLPPGTTDVTVHIAVDNDFELFWNGTEVGAGAHEGCAAHDSFVVDVPDSALAGGRNVLAVRARDRAWESLLDLRVTANFPPLCATVELRPAMLWPPNHQFRTVTAHGGFDPEGSDVTLAVTGVTQDEALDGRADGNTSPDASREGVAEDQVRLRAERSGAGDGRVYRVEVTATDADGATCTTTIQVGVPHDRRGEPAVDTAGVVVDSFGPPPEPTVATPAPTGEPAAATAPAAPPTAPPAPSPHADPVIADPVSAPGAPPAPATPNPPGGGRGVGREAGRGPSSS